MPQERNHVSAGATDGDSYPTITTESGASGIAPDHSSGLPRDASGGTHGSIQNLLANRSKILVTRNEPRYQEGSARMRAL
jgi:hypothetical protein